MRTPWFLCVLAAMNFTMLSTGCRSIVVYTSPPTRSATEKDPLLDYGDQQGWSHWERNWFYNTSQGSQLIKYDWVLALEQPDNAQLFLDDAHMEKLRFIPRGFDPKRPDRKNHLPIGMVKDGLKNQFGFTCAACHTSQLEYNGNLLRVDGAGTLADTVGFLTNLTASVNNTVNQDAKFDRFAKRVFNDKVSEAKKKKLMREITEYLQVRKSYDFRNRSPVTDGFGRLDAFGRIYNKALYVANPVENKTVYLKNYGTVVHETFNPPDAPVSYPFLWGTDQSDFVQWVGLAPNAGVGSFGRNVGEVLGVFANVEYKKGIFLSYFKSSVRPHSLINLEQSLRQLESPSWASYKALPEINEDLAKEGALVFEDNCVRCHNPVNRTKRRRVVTAFMDKIDATPGNPNVIGTDPRTAENIVNRTGKSGLFAGTSGMIKRTNFMEEEPVVDIVRKVGEGVIIPLHIDSSIRVLFNSLVTGRGLIAPVKKGSLPPYDQENLRAYKGRSLNGVWATAPYLHNGSVPNMWELLKPVNQRIREFHVGSREFDPKNMGLVHTPESGTFLFDTTKPSNSNAGHEYGTNLTDEEKWAIIEYMKTDMNL